MYFFFIISARCSQTLLHKVTVVEPLTYRHDFKRWEVVEYKYFVTVLKYIFLVSVLCSTTYFSDDFLLLLLTFLTQIPELSTSYIFQTGWLL